MNPGMLGGLTAWLATLVFLRRHRIWLLFYIAGAVGLTLFGVYFIRGTPAEGLIERLTAWHAHHLASLVNIETRVFTNAPGTLLVLVVTQPVGWTVVRIGLECSGVLELIVFVSLLLFYPAMGWLRKAWLGTLGVLAIYAANLLRVLTILVLLAWGGKGMIFVAHTIIARALFFGLMLAVYWPIFTRTTTLLIRRRLEG